VRDVVFGASFTVCFIIGYFFGIIFSGLSQTIRLRGDRGTKQIRVTHLQLATKQTIIAVLFTQNVYVLPYKNDVTSKPKD
jgi:hypothetical protein